MPARVVLGVAGGIAAYKACEVLRGLTESGCDVTVVPTAAALRFVGAATWAALSGKPVATDVWQDAHACRTCASARTPTASSSRPPPRTCWPAPTHGIADDLLTNVLLTARCPVVLAPAMHTEMWEHPATRRNVALLRERGVLVLDPASGRLTGADTGPGRLPDPAAIVAAVHDVLRGRAAGRSADLVGRRVVVSAGGTREELDPVRFIGNRSSGTPGRRARAYRARPRRHGHARRRAHGRRPAGRCHGGAGRVGGPDARRPCWRRPRARTSS